MVEAEELMGYTPMISNLTMVGSCCEYELLTYTEVPTVPTSLRLRRSGAKRLIKQSSIL